MSAFFISHPREADLSLFAGGELGPLSRWRIERHLEGCDHCRESVSDFFRLQSELNELGDTPEVDWGALKLAIHNDVVAARVEGQAVPARFGWAWQFGLVAASVVCGVAVVNEWREPAGEVRPAIESRSAQPTFEAQRAEAEPEIEEKAKEGRDQVAQSSEQQPPRVQGLQKLEAVTQGRAVSATVPAQFADRLVADTVAPPPPTAPYEIEAQPMVEAREVDALGELESRASSADYRQALPPPAPVARRLSAPQLVDAPASAKKSASPELRVRLRSVLDDQGPEGLRKALEALRTSGSRLRHDSGSDQVESGRLLRLFDTRGLAAVIEDLSATD